MSKGQRAKKSARKVNREVKIWYQPKGEKLYRLIALAAMSRAHPVDVIDQCIELVFEDIQRKEQERAKAMQDSNNGKPDDSLPNDEQPTISDKQCDIRTEGGELHDESEDMSTGETQELPLTEGSMRDPGVSSVDENKES